MRIWDQMRDRAERQWLGLTWLLAVLAVVVSVLTGAHSIGAYYCGYWPDLGAMMNDNEGKTSFAYMDFVTEVDGHVIHGQQDLLTYYSKLPIGRIVDHTVIRLGQVAHVAVPVRQVTVEDWFQLRLPNWGFGAMFGLLGGLLAWRAGHRPDVRVFSALCAAYFMAAMINAEGGSTPWTMALMSFASLSVGNGHVRLALHLRARRLNAWAEVTALIISVTALALFPIHGVTDQTSWSAAGAWLWMAIMIGWPLLAGLIVFPVMIAANMKQVKRFSLSYQQNRIILWSTILAYLPVGIAWTGPFFGLDLFHGWANLSLISFLWLPAGTLLAVLRYRLFDVERLIRHAITYSVLIGSLSMLYAASVWLMIRYVSDSIGEGARFGILVFAVLAFEPLRRQLHGLIDRWFDRGATSILDIQRKLNQRAAEHQDTSQTLEGVARDIEQALHLTKCGLALSHEDHFWIVAGTADLLGAMVAREALPAATFWERATHPAFPWPEGVMAAQAVVLRERVNAVIFLGDKESQEPITASDHDHLALIAGQIGLLLSYTEILDRQAIVDREMQKLLSKVSELNDLRSSFGIVAGHELRTPLTVIKGHAELLLSGSFGDLDDQQTESVQSIHRSASLMATQISAYLDLIALREKRLVLRPTVCDLGTVIYEALEPWDTEIESKSLSLRVDVSVADKAFADSRRVRQVIEQLVSNAVKFTPSGGSIIITARTKNRHVLLQVQDNGPGIPPEALDRAFDDFAQVADPTQRDHGGLGMGLPLSKALMEVMQGWIEYTSAPEGGSIFTCGFPRPQPVRDRSPGLLLELDAPLRTHQVYDEETGLWRVRPDVQDQPEPSQGITLANVVYETPTIPSTDQAKELD